MNHKLQIALDLINNYRNFIRCLEVNCFDHSDFYDDDIELLEALSSEGLLEPIDQMEQDLLGLCEDNEEMKEAIKNYFAEKDGVTVKPPEA